MCTLRHSKTKKVNLDHNFCKLLHIVWEYLYKYELLTLRENDRTIEKTTLRILDFGKF